MKGGNGVHLMDRRLSSREGTRRNIGQRARNIGGTFVAPTKRSR